MKLEATDFLNTAELLNSYDDEEHLRTSVSRSYFATYLYFRNYLAAEGLKKTKEAHEAHVFVRDCLQFCGVKKGNKVSLSLQKLNQLRTDADYLLYKQMPPNAYKDALDKARKTIADFEEATPQEKRKIVDGAAEHAKIKGWT